MVDPATAVKVATTGAQVALGVGGAVGKFHKARQKKKKQKKALNAEGGDPKKEGGGEIVKAAPNVQDNFEGAVARRPYENDYERTLDYDRFQPSPPRGGRARGRGRGRRIRRRSPSSSSESSDRPRRTRRRSRRSESSDSPRRRRFPIQRARSADVIERSYDALVQLALDDVMFTRNYTDPFQNSIGRSHHSPRGHSPLTSLYNDMNMLRPPPFDHDMRYRGQSLLSPYAPSRYQRPFASCPQVSPFANTLGVGFATPSHSYDHRHPFSMSSIRDECQDCRIFHAYGHHSHL